LSPSPSSVAHRQGVWRTPDADADLSNSRACSQVRCSYTVGVAALRFEWDDRKNRANIRKHRVSFEEAQTVFLDENAMLIDDPEHSSDEDRFVLLGLSANLRILVVCHAYRPRGDVIRIISARKADAGERDSYIQRGRR